MNVTTTTKTISATHQAVTDFMRANQHVLGNLWARWQDEKAHEDINDYGAALAKKFPEGWKLLKTTKRPFGVVVAIGDQEWTIKVAARSMEWNRTK